MELTLRPVLGNTWASYVNCTRPKIRMCFKRLSNSSCDRGLGSPVRHFRVAVYALCFPRGYGRVSGRIFLVWSISFHKPFSTPRLARPYQDVFRTLSSYDLCSWCLDSLLIAIIALRFTYGYNHILIPAPVSLHCSISSEKYK